MNKLRAILFKNLSNAAHYDFDVLVSSECAASPQPVVAALGQLPTLFNVLLAEEKTLIEWVRKNALTKEIADADHRMDRALTALKMQVRALEYNNALAIAEAARHTYTMLCQYGDVANKAYSEQISDVRTILQQFAGPYAPDVSRMGIGYYISELQAFYNLFRQLLTQRDAQKILKPEKGFREVRRNIEEVYRQIENVINSGSAFNPTAGFQTFINRLNPEISRLNEEFHRLRRNMGDAQPEPIPAQTYTGKPLTPLFKVLYVTSDEGAIELELGKDFNLTYDDNINVGMAQCTVRGKGLYKGNKTVTFDIVRNK
jgi:hypothetical protein